MMGYSIQAKAKLQMAAVRFRSRGCWKQQSYGGWMRSYTTSFHLSGRTSIAQSLLGAHVASQSKSE
jgi:hypothetical protein